MPREGVPYPERVLCSLKNTIAMIEQKLGLKIEKVNGVGPDPSGNVTIASGDSALTVEEDASQHLITIGLDRAELPSAAVTSVNGETGAVSLDASEIPGKGANKTVMDNINTLETVGLQMRSDLNDEINARGNADSALQNNINTLQASIPSAAADAVDNSPTIQQLVYADQNENLKIVNVNQYAVGLTGNQSNIAGLKDFNYPPRHDFKALLGSGGYWYKIWESEESAETVWRNTIVEVVFRNDNKFAHFYIGRRSISQNECVKVYGNYANNTVIFTRDANGKCTLWTSYVRFSAWIVFDGRANTIDQNTDSTTIPDTTGYAQPQASDYAALFYVN